MHRKTDEYTIWQATTEPLHTTSSPWSDWRVVIRCWTPFYRHLPDCLMPHPKQRPTSLFVTIGVYTAFRMLSPKLPSNGSRKQVNIAGRNCKRRLASGTKNWHSHGASLPPSVCWKINNNTKMPSKRLYCRDSRDLSGELLLCRLYDSIAHLFWMDSQYSDPKGKTKRGLQNSTASHCNYVKNMECCRQKGMPLRQWNVQIRTPELPVSKDNQGEKKCLLLSPVLTLPMTGCTVR